MLHVRALNTGSFSQDIYTIVRGPLFFFIIWFVRLLALRPLVAYLPASGDSEDDCGEADGM
jgi:hypothetical protein